MKTLKFIFLSLLGILTLISIFYFIKYFFTTEFMPYHAEAIGCQWFEVPNNFKPLLLTLLKMTSLYFLVMGLFLIGFFIQYFSHKEFTIEVPLWGSITSTLMTYIVYSLHCQTGANTPYILSGISCLIFISTFIIGFVIKMKG